MLHCLHTHTILFIDHYKGTISHSHTQAKETRQAKSSAGDPHGSLWNCAHNNHAFERTIWSTARRSRWIQSAAPETKQKMAEGYERKPCAFSFYREQNPLPLTKTEKKTEILNAFTTSARCGKRWVSSWSTKSATMLLHIHIFFISTEGIPLHAVYPAWPSGEQGGKQWGEQTRGRGGPMPLHLTGSNRCEKY